VGTEIELVSFVAKKAATAIMYTTDIVWRGSMRCYRLLNLVMQILG